MADARIHQHVKYITPVLNHRLNTDRESWTLGSPKPPGVAMTTFLGVFVEHKGTQKRLSPVLEKSSHKGHCGAQV